MPSVVTVLRAPWEDAWQILAGKEHLERAKVVEGFYSSLPSREMRLVLGV